jgi:MinD-like ATPase involved in chromosome partitioning or flagellar assembly
MWKNGSWQENKDSSSPRFVNKSVVTSLVDGLRSARSIPPRLFTGKSKKDVGILRTSCKQLGIALFLQREIPMRSLGFTSAIPGEGKTFLSRLTAEVMLEDSGLSVTLLECNWEHPTLSLVYNLASGPGLSEWLQGHCSLEAIRQQVTSNLTVIPAGENNAQATHLLRILQQKGVHSILTDPNEILIIDLPATVTTAYGPFAAQLADTLILVVRMGVTPESYIAEACHFLKDLHMHGIIFNQVASHIPHWLRRIF